MSKRICLLLLCVIVTICATAQEYRDVVFLKNGSVIKGFYRELYTADSLRLETIDGGVLVCAFSDIERIAKERNDVYLVDMGDSYKHEDVEWRHKGYRGTIEYGMSYNLDDSRLKITSYFTTHGYQFNRYLFAGIGIGYEQITITQEGFSFIIDEHNVPIFADARLYLAHGSIVPVIDARLGYAVSGYKGFYANPNLGVDFSFSPRFGAFLLLGYFSQDLVIDNVESNYKYLSLHLGLHF